VSRIFALERSSFHVGTGDERTVMVEPDKTTFVDLGGTGRPVVGRFVLPRASNQARSSFLQPRAWSWSGPSRPAL